MICSRFNPCVHLGGNPDIQDHNDRNSNIEYKLPNTAKCSLTSYLSYKSNINSILILMIKTNHNRGTELLANNCFLVKGIVTL